MGRNWKRYRVFANGRFWREMSLTKLLASLRQRFHVRSSRDCAL